MMFLNQVKSGILLFGLVALLTALGWALGSKTGALIGLVVSGAMSFMSYWNSDKMVLSAYRGQQVDRNSKLYQMVDELAKRAKLPTPKVYIIPEQQPNAFATGRDPQHAAVACTEGLLQIMNENELSGVLAHELGHIAHRDILVSTIAATFAGAISNIARFLPMFARSNGENNRERQNRGNLAMILTLTAPVAAAIIQMTISRRREFMADRAGADYSGNPLYLRDALVKLENYSRQITMSYQNPATSHMFIVNPLAGLSKLQNLFRTHPATSDRIRELESYAREKGIA